MIKTIVKQDSEGIILFFPEYPANPGFIMYWNFRGGHGEACIDYMRRCKRADINSAIVKNAIDYYDNLDNYEKLIICKRDSKKMQSIRYKLNFKG